MNKKIVIGIVAVLIVVIAVIVGWFLLNNNGKTNQKETTSSSNSTGNENKTTSSNGKILVVYYSATGSTENVAEQIAENLDADLFEIVPEDVYTREDLDWTNEKSRVSREHDDESLRDVKLQNTKVENWDSYDTVFIGYPIWWGVAAWPVDTFVKANDFNGKTVIPFCTSASSGLGQSGDLLAKEANAGNWEEGYRFSSGASSSTIKDWTDRLK